MRTSTIFALALPAAVVLAQDTTRVTSTILNPITTIMTYSASSSLESIISNTSDATGVMTAFGNSTSSGTVSPSSTASQLSSASISASPKATGSSDAGAFEPNIAMAVFAAAIALF